MARAASIINLCATFHCLPSQILEEPVEVVQLLQLAALAEEGDSGG